MYAPLRFVVVPQGGWVVLPLQSCWQRFILNTVIYEMYISQEHVGFMEPQAKRWKGPISVTEDSWVAYPVLSDQQSQDIEMIEAFAAPIVDKKETSRLVHELNTIHPFSGLQHLKRVRAVKDKVRPHSLEVLLCLVQDAPSIEAPVSVDSLLLGVVRPDGLGPPFVVKVPARAPLTRAQFELVSQQWPTSFHEDKQVTAALKGELFSPEQKARMQSYMTAALAAAEAGRDLGMEPVGAAMVDPATETIVAVGHDCRADHPLHHAVMVCIDLVARSQGGGCYCFDKYPSCSFAPLDSDTTAPAYICTGYDLYVTREPCVMCAMALVHSRIGRVFYGTVSSDGALGTKYKIHSQKDLNHRFEVYKGVLGRQCEELINAHVKNANSQNV